MAINKKQRTIGSLLIATALLFPFLIKEEENKNVSKETIKVKIEKKELRDSKDFSCPNSLTNDIYFYTQVWPSTKSFLENIENLKINPVNKNTSDIKAKITYVKDIVNGKRVEFTLDDEWRFHYLEREESNISANYKGISYFAPLDISKDPGLIIGANNLDAIREYSLNRVWNIDDSLISNLSDQTIRKLSPNLEGVLTRIISTRLNYQGIDMHSYNSRALLQSDNPKGEYDPFNQLNYPVTIILSGPSEEGDIASLIRYQNTSAGMRIPLPSSNVKREIMINNSRINP